MISFKKIVKPASLILAIASLIGSYPFASAQSAPVKIVVADAKTTHHLNLYVAQDLGIFKKYNLDVSIVPVADLAAARDLVVSGQADVFWSCPTVAIAAIANGAPIKIISQVKKPCTSVLLVPQGSSIIKYSDLKDKNIAGISPTCESVIALSVAAKRNGGQFNLQKLAGGPALAALEAKQVDGAILEEPQASIAELKGYKVLFKEAAENIPCRTINSRNAFLKSNAKDLKTFIKAVGEANAIILSNPVAPNIVDIAVKYTGAPVEAIKYGNHRLKFRTNIDKPGLFLLGNELIELKNIKENPGNKLYADEFRGITWN
ncbi:MAG: ABC transporter substrate-binding protein [Chlorobiaceae bacterium]|nr:ABC transporter substrate-binding protein [Chlorobiaceae bacterium]